MSDAESKANELAITVKSYKPAVWDLLAGKAGGRLTESVTVDAQDFTSVGAPGIVRVAGTRELEIVYESPTGNRYVNGEWEEFNG